MVGLFTIILVVVNVATAVVFWRQLNVMQGQLDEAKSATLISESQLRANLRHDATKLTPVSQDGRPNNATNRVLAAWSVNPVWTNVGGTSALDYRGWFDIKIAAPHPGTPVSAADCPKPTPPEPLQEATSISPGGSTTHLAKIILLNDVMKARDNQVNILLYGHVEYRDIFEGTRMHHEDWCIAVLPNDPDNSVFSFLNLIEKTD